jgi:glycosyltransferase involved in cell wall biosynthesis
MKSTKPERESGRGTRESAGHVAIVRYAPYPQHAHVRRDAETLTANGYEVDLICLREKGQPSRETINGVRVYRLPLRHHRRGIPRYIYEYFAFFLLTFFQLTWLSLQRKYRVVEVDTPPDFVVFAAIVPRMRGAKVILYLFDHVPQLIMEKINVSAHHWTVKIALFVEKMSVRWVNYVIGTQIINKQIVEKHGVPSSKISVVLNVPNDQIFNGRPAPSRNTEELSLITHGSLLEKYGVQSLVKAAPLLRKEIPLLKIKIVGTGEYRPNLERLSESLGVADCIEFTGFVPNPEIPKRITEADIGVVTIATTINPMLPNKLFEYLAMGIPVVTTSIPAITAYFDDKSVMYYEPENEQDLARCILELYRSPQRRQSLAETGWSKYQQYRWSTMKYEYLNVYKRLVK